MENKKINLFKIILTSIFAVAILGTYAYRLWKGEPWDKSYLSYGAISLCFLFALIFIDNSAKKISFVCALALNVLAEYFFVFKPFESSELIGVCLLLAVQFVFMIYTLIILRVNFLRAIMVGLRIALTLSIFLILPRYLTLSTLWSLYIVCIANAFVTFVCLALKIKTEWLTILGFLLLLISSVFAGFANGGIELLGITGKFAEIVAKFDFAYYYYIPGLFLITLSSVWGKKGE